MVLWGSYSIACVNRACRALFLSHSYLPSATFTIGVDSLVIVVALVGLYFLLFLVFIPCWLVSYAAKVERTVVFFFFLSLLSFSMVWYRRRGI